MDVVEHLQPAVVLPQGLAGPLTLRDVPLDAEMAGNSALGIVETEVVTFDPDRCPVDPSLVGFHVQTPAIEEFAPDTAAVGQIVTEEVFRCRAEKLLARGAVLREHRVVDLGHPLMLEDVVENALLVDRIIPTDGLVDHHEEEAVQRLRKEELETVVGVHRWSSRGLIVLPFYNGIL